MSTYTVTAINVSSFHLGEADKGLGVFSAERGPLRLVAKGARKPGSKVSGRAELLQVNTYLVARGRSLDIITQSDTVESFSALRGDLSRLTCGLYYAELTQHFGQGLADDSSGYLEFLRLALRRQAEGSVHCQWLCLEFELKLLEFLGYQPELTYCIHCREALTGANLASFHQDWGGIACRKCSTCRSRDRGRLPSMSLDRLDQGGDDEVSGVEITPLVWQYMVLAASSGSGYRNTQAAGNYSEAAVRQARRLTVPYVEARAGRKMKSLELIRELEQK